MQFPLRLKLYPSRRLAVLLALLHLAGIAGIVPLDLSLWLKLLACAAASASALASIRRHALLAAPGSVRELVLLVDGSVEGERRKRGAFTAAVSPRSTVFPWLVVVLLEVADSRRLLPVVLLPDSLAPDQLRALRSWLRWKACPGVSGA